MNNTVPPHRHGADFTLEREFRMETEEDFGALLDSFVNSVYYYKATAPDTRSRVKFQTFKMIMDALNFIDLLTEKPLLEILLGFEDDEDHSFMELSYALVKIIADPDGAFKFPFSIEGGTNNHGQMIAVLRFYGRRRDTPPVLQHYWNTWTDMDGNFEINE